MMEKFLGFIIGIVIAQTLGVLMTWKIESKSWNWRPLSDISVSNFATDCLRAVGLFALFLLLIFGMSAPWFFAPPLLWLLLVARVQKRQLNVSFSDAFCGALLQFGCFGLLLFCGGFLASIFRWFLNFGSFLTVWLVSAMLTHALLSLFRPTIYGTLDTYRQTTGKK